MRRYIRPPRFREALLGGLIFMALVLGAWMDRGTNTGDTASMLPADTATPTMAADAPAQSADEVDSVTYLEGQDEDGNASNNSHRASNTVRLVNKKDNGLRIKSNIELNRITADSVTPSNVAFAYATCTDCQTLTVALQIDLISRTASVVAPENAAIALNYQCTRCYTRAWALQYVISVDDPKAVPKDVSELIKAMDKELNAIHADKSVTLEQAISRIEAVITQFKTLGESLKEQSTDRTDTTSPGATDQP